VSEENFRALGLRHFGRLQAPKGVRFYGQVITAVFAVLGALFLYTAILSKLLPDSGNVVVDFIKRDYYFCVSMLCCLGRYWQARQDHDSR
jgi:hypothetical protein